MVKDEVLMPGLSDLLLELVKSLSHVLRDDVSMSGLDLAMVTVDMLHELVKLKPHDQS
jgi:hypothetical protein